MNKTCNTCRREHDAAAIQEQGSLANCFHSKDQLLQSVDGKLGLLALAYFPVTRYKDVVLGRVGQGSSEDASVSQCCVGECLRRRRRMLNTSVSRIF